jgi:hypothetical protein
MGLRSINNLKSPFEDVFSNTGPLNESLYVRHGLLLYLDAGDSDSYGGSGSTWTDLSGNGNDVTLYNSPTFSNDNGGCLDFDSSSSEYGLCSGIDNFDGNTKDITIATWFKSEVVNAHRNILGFRPDGSEGFYMLCLANTSDRLECRAGTDSGYDDITYPSGNVDIASDFNNLCFTFNHSNNTISLYLNGQLVDTNTNANGSDNWPADMGNFAICRNANSAFAYGNGKMAIAFLYERCLSAAEVEKNYNAHKGRFE